MSGLFVTGTGTEVGKSVVAAVIARTLARRGRKVAVFKPALSGLDEPGEPDHHLLRRASGSLQTDDEIAPYRFGPAVSPHLAAELSGDRIEHDRLVTAATAAAAQGDVLVCEGVGGLLVPLTARFLVRDFALALGLPLVVVATSGLGTINHTLLTLEAARAVGLSIAAVVLNPWPEKPSAMERSNRDAIARIGEIAVLTLGVVDLDDPANWPELDPGDA